MEQKKVEQRWVYVVILFFFLLFHQLDVFLLGPLSARIIENFFAPDLLLDPFLIGVIICLGFFLVWGYLYDRHSRKRLFSIACFLWGVTSWLMGIAPTLGTYIISNAAGGIDNASYSGIFAVVGDFFSPRNRGKILGLIVSAKPLALFFALLLTQTLLALDNWRLLLMIMGLIGFSFSLLFFFLFHEPKRGACEPALAEINLTGFYKFDWEIAKEELVKPSLLVIYATCFFEIIPWIVLSSWVLPLLGDISAPPISDILQSIIPALIALTLGYPIAGMLGDRLFRRKITGRIIVSLFGAALPGLFLLAAVQITDIQSPYFMIFLTLMGFFMAFCHPNLISSVMDITLPELRASANAAALFFQALGAICSSYLMFRLQATIGSQVAIPWVCVGAWMIIMILQIGLLLFLPRDIEHLRQHMAYRNLFETRLEKSEGTREAWNM